MTHSKLDKGAVQHNIKFQKTNSELLSTQCHNFFSKDIITILFF